MEITASAVKDFLRSEGMDLVAIADAGTLVLAYPPRPATALMPTARSVIVMAVAHRPSSPMWTSASSA